MRKLHNGTREFNADFVQVADALSELKRPKDTTDEHLHIPSGHDESA